MTQKRNYVPDSLFQRLSGGKKQLARRLRHEKNENKLLVQTVIKRKVGGNR